MKTRENEAISSSPSHPAMSVINFYLLGFTPVSKRVRISLKGKQR